MSAEGKRGWNDRHEEKKKGKKGRGRERASEVFVLEVRERAQRCGECRLTERCAVQNVISIHLPRILQRTKGEKKHPKAECGEGGGLWRKTR